jgi:hypothetical protein
MTSSNLFDDIFPNSIEVNKRQFFKIRVLKICDQLFSSGQLTEKQKDDVSHLLRSIPKDLRNEGDAERDLKIPLTMGEAPICHLINWMPKKSGKEISLLKAFVFIAAICWQDEQDLDGTETTIADACRVVRQSEDGTGQEVLQLLSFSGGFERLCHSIEQQKGKLNKESKLAKRLTKLFTLLNAYHSERSYIEQNDDTDIETELVLQDVILGDDGYSLKELKEIFKSGSGLSQEDFEEERCAEIYLRSNPTSQNESNFNLAQTRYREKGVIHAYIRQNIPSPCDLNNMTQDEAEVLFKFWLNKIYSQDIGALFLMLSLLLGQNAAELYEGLNSSYLLDGGELVWTLSPELPTHNLSDVALEKSNEHITEIELVLPSFLSCVVLGRRSSKIDLSEVKKEVRRCLKESNQAFKTKVTEVKISKHAYNYYLWSGEDEAVAAILTNRSPTNCTQLYYSSFDEVKLNTPFRTYLQKYFSYALPNEWLYELIVFSGPTGTHIRPKKEEIAKLLSILYLAMEKHHNYQSFHNALIVYMWIVMALYTSHRPVNSPFDLFSDLANESAFIWMCDKFSKKELTFRLVPKSKWIKRNIKRYSDHLKYIKIQCQNNKAVAAYIDKANENKAPFFFAFRDGKPIDVSPKWLAEQLDEIWPFPLNFPRHVSRGTLQTRKVLPEQMDAFMGHGTVGKDPLGQYSGFSLSDLSNITREIEDSLEELKIKDILVWRVK